MSIFGNVFEDEDKKREQGGGDTFTVSKPSSKIFGDVFADAGGSEKQQQVDQSTQSFTASTETPEKRGFFAKAVDAGKKAVKFGLDAWNALQTRNEASSFEMRERMYHSTVKTDPVTGQRTITSDRLERYKNAQTPEERQKIVAEQTAEIPLIKMMNSKTGKEVIAGISEGTSNIPLKIAAGAKSANYNPVGIPLKTFAGMVGYGDKIYDEAYASLLAERNDPTNNAFQKFLYEIQDTGVQSAVGMLLALGTSYATKSPTTGYAVSSAYYTALSADEQLVERGKVDSLGNIAIDVVGDQVLNTMLIKVLGGEASGSVLKSALKGFGVEGSTEVSQSLLKYANDYGNARTEEQKQRVLDEAKRYVVDGGMAMEFFVGGTVGGIISGGVEYFAPNVSQEQVADTRKDIMASEAFDLERAVESGDVERSQVYQVPEGTVEERVSRIQSNPSEVLLYRGQSEDSGGLHFTDDPSWSRNFGDEEVVGRLPKNARIYTLTEQDLSISAELGATTDAEMYQRFFDMGYDAVIGTDSRNASEVDIVVNPEIVSGFSKVDGDSVVKLSPKFAEGRVNDIAQKLGKLSPELESAFRERVDVNNVHSVAELQVIANGLLNRLNRTNPSSQPNQPTTRPNAGQRFIPEVENADIGKIADELTQLERTLDPNDEAQVARVLNLRDIMNDYVQSFRDRPVYVPSDTIDSPTILVETSRLPNEKFVVRYEANVEGNGIGATYDFSRTFDTQEEATKDALAAITAWAQSQEAQNETQKVGYEKILDYAKNPRTPLPPQIPKEKAPKVDTTKQKTVKPREEEPVYGAKTPAVVTKPQQGEEETSKTRKASGTEEKPRTEANKPKKAGKTTPQKKQSGKATKKVVEKSKYKTMKEASEALKEAGRIDGTEADIQKFGKASNGTSISSFEKGTDLLAGGYREGVLTDGFLLIKDRKIAESEIPRLADKRKNQSSTLGGYKQMMWEDVKKLVEKAPFPDISFLLDKPIGEKATIEGYYYEKRNAANFVSLKSKNHRRAFMADKLAYMMKMLPDAEMHLTGNDRVNDESGTMLQFVRDGEVVGFLMGVHRGGNPFEIEKVKLDYKIPKGADGFVAPRVSSGDDYRGAHEAPMADSGVPLHDLTANDNQVYPDDVYSARASTYYGAGETYDGESIAIAQSFKGRPNATVTIYRAVPSEKTNAESITELEAEKAYILKRGKLPDSKFRRQLETTGITFSNTSQYYDMLENEIERLKTVAEPKVQEYKINAGDWVTINRKYAKTHGESNLGGNYKIISKKVKASEVFTDGNSIHEWGYDPHKNIKRGSTDGFFGDARTAGFEDGGQPETKAAELPAVMGGIKEINPIEMPELVDIARELSGEVPAIRKKISSTGTLGLHQNGKLKILASLFEQGNMPMAAKVMAHEIGHLIDFMPDRSPNRNRNLIGRIFTLRNFMKETFHPSDGSIFTTEERAEIRREVESDYRAKNGIKPKEKLSLAQKAEVKKEYQRIVKMVLDNDGFIQEEVLKKELIEATRYWNPYDPAKVPPSYKAYRESTAELYAEALSMLFNAPNRLKSIAPTFYERFFEALDRKPNVRNVYFEIQALLSGDRELIVKRRREGVKTMFKEGDYKAIELHNRKVAEKEERRKQYWQHFKHTVIDKNFQIIDRVKKAQREGKKINPDENPVYFLEERNYLGGKIKAIFEREYNTIYQTLTENEIAWEDFGEVLFYMRIAAGDRSDVANPRGITPDAAKELVKDVTKNYTTEQRKLLMENVVKFQEASRKITEEAFGAGLYKPELYQKMQENPAYVTFQVLDHLENGMTSRVYKSIGTLKDIANPADSTMLKVIATIRATERNKVTKSVVDFLRSNFAEEIEEAKYSGSAKGRFPIPSRDPNKELITYFEKGVMKGYYVDPYIAESINSQSVGSNAPIIPAIRFMNSTFFRPLFISFNLGFQSFNLIRDFVRTYKNFPKLSFAKTFQLYGKAGKVARIRAFGKPKNPTASDLEAIELLNKLEEEKVLSVTFNDIASGQTELDKQVEKILAETGIKDFQPEPRIENVPRFAKPAVNVLEKAGVLKVTSEILGFIENLGNLIETLPKAAGTFYLIEQNKGEFLTQEQQSFIRRKIGSPDFLAGGTYKPITNEVFLFSNAIIQGIRSDIEIATEPQTRSGWWWKTTKVTFLPKMLMFAVLMGAFGDEWKELMESASEYDRTNYNIIPLGKDENGKAIYLRIPVDETSRFLGGILWKALAMGRNEQTFAQDLLQVMSYTGGQIPSLSPAIQSFAATAQYLSGQNPYDWFRGRNVISDTVFQAGGTESLKSFLGWQFQQLGGGIFYRFYHEPTAPKEQSTAERIFNLPLVGNVLGRFVRVSDYGKLEQLRAVEKRVQKEEAQQVLKDRELVNKYLERAQKENIRFNTRALEEEMIREAFDGLPNTEKEKEKATRLTKKLRLGIKRGDSDANVVSLIDANTNAQKLELLKVIREDMTADEFNVLKRDLIENKIVSTNVFDDLEKGE